MSTWVEGKLLGFDLETTGVDTENDHPVSFAFVYYEDKKVCLTHSDVVNPGIPIPEAAFAVHGISNEEASLGIPMDLAVAEISATLLDTSRWNIPVVGMNVSFDLQMIDRLSDVYLDESLWKRDWMGPVIDILVIDRHYDQYRKGGRKLVDLCKHYGVDTSEGLHDAEKDVEATVKVLFKMVERYPELEQLQLYTLFELQQDWHRRQMKSLNSYFVSKGNAPFTEKAYAWPIYPMGL